jgi:hypothetical protein
MQAESAHIIINNKKFWEKINHIFSLIRHESHRKRRIQQFFYCCVCIRYHGNVYTEPLPSNDRKGFTEPLPTNDNGAFAESLPSNDRGDKQTRTHTDINVI